jgi:predicted DCC family thiol-disulfide oxidoreductase YuxK
MTSGGVPDRRQPELLFYDGTCGLCHRAVRLVLAFDPTGTAFRFAPLQGPTFASMVPESRRAGLPDSLVVRTREGALLVRSTALRHVANRLGGLWRLLSALAGLLPPLILDAAYDAVASRRRRCFAPPGDSCPLGSPDARARFDP